jgi:hypothetical protein
MKTKIKLGKSVNKLVWTSVYGSVRSIVWRSVNNSVTDKVSRSVHSLERTSINIRI